MKLNNFLRVKKGMIQNVLLFSPAYNLVINSGLYPFLRELPVKMDLTEVQEAQELEELLENKVWLELREPEDPLEPTESLE